MKASPVLAGLALSLTTGLLYPFPGFAQDRVDSPNNSAITRTIAAISETDYVLGADDQIRIDIFNVPDLSGQNGTYTILSNGSLNLPWVGEVQVAGLSLRAAGEAIAAQYSRFIREPVVTVSLLNARPMRLAIVGEVNRPGVYTTGQAAESGPAGELTGDTAGQLRTVTQALQTAGGITQLADIRNIEVRRPRSGGVIETIDINLWELLQRGDLNEDFTLRDGDTLVVPTASELNIEEASQLAAASFSPSTINVNVVGEVNRPGNVTISPNTALNQAILAAGGFHSRRARTTNVELIRLNPNGSVSKRTVPIDLTAGLNEGSNPALRNNDIIIVGRSNSSRFADFMESILAPLNPLRPVVDIVDTLFNNN